MAPVGRSCSTIRVHGCCMACDSARSTHPSGSSQSRGMAFHNTQSIALPFEIGDDIAIEEPPVQVAAAPERTEELLRMRQRPYRVLRSADLTIGKIGLGTHSERRGMGETVIADPVTFGMRPLGDSARRGDETFSRQ